ncbi:MAG TPA: helicase-related protein, partial [bacterium]|nr:helicase-related protein [bacterium]
LALTATATPEVRQDIIKQLDMKDPVELITGFARENLHFGIISTPDGNKKNLVLDTIEKAPEASGIIYTSTRHRADELAEFINRYGASAVVYHAGLTPEERQRLQNRFMTGQANIIVATNAFGMGIDKADLRFVIHYDMPGTIEAYYQEAGRAGRDGQPSLCLLLHSPRDRYLQEFFIEGDNPSIDLILDIYDFLTSHSDDHILLTYNGIKEKLSLDVPDLAIGTAIKVLEKEGYLAKSYEKTSQASLKLLSPTTTLLDGQNALGSRAKKSIEIWNNLYENYADKLKNGLAINLENLALELHSAKDSLTRLLKKLQEKELLSYEPPFKGTEITILKRCDRSEVELDRKALREKMKFAKNKLDQMEDYVYHQGCRQEYILNYFGETDAPECGHCDWCLKRHSNLRPDKKDRSVKRSGSFNNYQKPVTKSKNYNQHGVTLETKLTQLTTLESYQSGLTIAEIAKERELPEDTIIEHLCYLVEKNLLKDVSRLVDDNTIAMVSDLLEQNPNFSGGQLTALKEQLPSYIDITELKIAISFLKANKKRR